MATITTTSSIRPACPSWCENPAGHDYDGIMNDGTDRLTRGHDLSLGSVKVTHWGGEGNSVYVDLRVEEIVEVDGTITVASPAIVLDGDLGCITADEARRIATFLQAAAARLDQLNGTTP